MTQPTPETTPTAKPENKTPLWKKVGGGVAAVVIAITLFGENGVDLAGDLKKHKSDQEISDEVWGKRAEDLAAMDRVEQFEAEFTEDKTYRVAPQKGGNGILGWGSDPDLAYVYGSDCLADTPYDTSPGKRTVQAAGVINDINRQNTIVVAPANERLPVLEVEVIDSNRLIAPSQQAKDILWAYGCDLEEFKA